MSKAKKSTVRKGGYKKGPAKKKTSDFSKKIRSLKLYELLFEKRIILFILSFFIPAVIMTYAFSLNKIHPFGDQQILVVDLWHQYYPFFKVVREKLVTHGSFLYSWENGLGTNFLSLISYYAASPLNWLSVFFDGDHIRDALTFILVMKIGFSGMFFSMFLSYTFKRRDLSMCVFSVMYALSSYTLGYYWNVMWFDTVALFPLVMLGLVALSREGKWKVYTFALALSLFANYYIAFFTCIFSVFMFLAAGIIEFKGIKDYLRKIWVVFRSSVLGLGLAAFMLLPAYFGLQLTYSANNIFPKETVWYEKWTDIFANLISYNAPTKVEGLPNIACGMLAVTLFGVFLFSFGIKIREKVSVLAMLALVIVSCNMNKLNYIWHGFHFTNQIPYRFAFIFCFVLAAAAYRAYDIMLEKGIKVYQLFLMIIGPAAVFYCNFKTLDINGVNIFHLTSKAALSVGREVYSLLILAALIAYVLPFVAAALIFDAVCKWKKLNKRIELSAVIAMLVIDFIVIAVKLFPALSKLGKLEASSAIPAPDGASEAIADKLVFGITEAFDKSVFITLAFLLIFVAAKVFPFKNKKVRNTIMNVVLGAVVFSEFISNAQLGVNTVSTTSYTSYPTEYVDSRILLDRIEDTEDSPFYRTEMNATWTLNDSALYGYYGLSQFSSSANVSVTKLIKRLGLYASEAGNRYYYRTATPFINSLFDIKYILKRNGSLNSEADFLEPFGSSGNVYAYKNKYPLSLGFMVNESLLSLTPESVYNPFEYQNDIIKNATGMTEAVFTAQMPALAEYENVNVDKNGFGNYQYRKTESGSEGAVTYTFDGIDGYTLYGYVGYPGNATCDDLTIKCNGSQVDDGGLIKDYGISFPMGNCHSGDKSTVKITTKTDRTSGDYKLMVYAMSNELFDKAYGLLADEQLNISSFKDAKIKGTINAKSDGILYLAMPYEKGWSVYVDGKKAETCKVLGAMMGARVSAGKHDIEIRYIPEGFIQGLLISIASLLLVILTIVLERYFRKRKAAKAAAAAAKIAAQEAEVPAPEELAAASEIYNQEIEDSKGSVTEEKEEKNEKSQGDGSVQGD